MTKSDGLCILANHQIFAHKLCYHFLMEILPVSEVVQTISGIKVSIVHGGRGEPLFLFPGWPSNFSADSNFLKLLSQYFEIFAINLPGFGCSQPLSTRPDLAGLVNLINSLVDTNKLKKVNLLGMSYGGMLALKYAVDFPDKVNRLVLVAPLLGYQYMTARIRAFYTLISLVRKILPVQKIINRVTGDEKLFSRLYYLLTGYDYDNDQNRKDYTSNRDNIKRMDFDKCFDMFAFLKNVDLKTDAKNVKAKTLILSGGNDTFVGTTPKLLETLIKDSKLMELNVQHWGLVNHTTIPQIIEFIKQEGD